MNVTTGLDHVWQQQATGLPQRLLETMSSGLDTGALTLSPAHVRSLDDYVKYARALPTSPAGLSQWGSGALVSQRDPVLNNDRLLVFFRQLRTHAISWEVVFEKNLQLTNVLAATADRFGRTGSMILDACAQTKALGKRREAWDALQHGDLTALSTQDRAIVASLPTHMNTLKGNLSAYSRDVERVRMDITVFRDEARFELIPEALRKVKGIEQYIRPTTKDFSPATMALVRFQRSLSELSGRIQTMEGLLRDVVTASSHFHSAWQSLTVYIESSDEKFQKITTGQALARFAIYFAQFLGLWGTIGESALEMNRTLTRLRP